MGGGGGGAKGERAIVCLLRDVGACSPRKLSFISSAIVFGVFLDSVVVLK